ncbi:MAG: ATP-binding protein [Comamonadaceae bacterium]|nr:ATP-binding protein [Comamonadaceae bacterium]
MAIDLTVMADETELGRVFANLFENARRYGRGTDTGVADVTVSYAQPGPWVIVSVRDHGPGVPPEKLAQLTTPFFRGDAARTAATGAGLGLAIVEKAMQRMGGSLELANAPDGGLMAHLRLSGRRTRLHAARRWSRPQRRAARALSAEQQAHRPRLDRAALARPGPASRPSWP